MASATGSTRRRAAWRSRFVSVAANGFTSGASKCYSLSQMEGLSLLQTIAVAMLILANAFFVAAEFALVSIRERIEQMLAARVPGARVVRLLQRGMEELLPAVQLGVTLCSLALGWLGEPLAT